MKHSHECADCGARFDCEEEELSTTECTDEKIDLGEDHFCEDCW